jgi:hypothetical protein
MTLRKIDLPSGWQDRIKSEAWRKINTSLLMDGCRRCDARALEALYCGYWNFVDTFPEVIQSTYREAPVGDSGQSRFLRRAAGILAGTLEGMEADERAHRTLWIKSAVEFGIEEKQLYEFPVVPEIAEIAATMSRETKLQRRLLQFVSTEIVAEGISNCLAAAETFKQRAGARGMGWFNVHLIHQDDETTHEAIAYNTAFMLMREAGEQLDEQAVGVEVQLGVDLFITAAQACCDVVGYQ